MYSNLVHKHPRWWERDGSAGDGVIVKTVRGMRRDGVARLGRECEASGKGATWGFLWGTATPKMEELGRACEVACLLGSSGARVGGVAVDVRPGPWAYGAVAVADWNWRNLLPAIRTQLNF